MSTEQNPSDFFSKLGETLGDAFERGRQELVRGAKVGRVAMDLRALEADRERLLMELGKAAAEALRDGRVKDDELAGHLDRLDALQKRIDALDGEKKKLKDVLADSEEKGHNPAPSAEEGASEADSSEE